MKYNSRIIIACDFSSINEMNVFLKKMKNEKLFLKIGMQLIYKEGFEFIKQLQEKGHNIFIDLKIYDIPNTAKEAVKSLLKYKPDFITAHISGGKKMLSEINEITKNTNTKILGVTLLTSQNKKDLIEMNINTSVEEHIKNLMQIAIKSNIKHIICSPHEANIAKEMELIPITPGVRIKNDSNHDQKRVMSPKEAFKNNASFIVIGRSITKSKNPLETYKLMKRGA